MGAFGPFPGVVMLVVLLVVVVSTPTGSGEVADVGSFTGCRCSCSCARLCPAQGADAGNFSHQPPASCA